MDEKTLMSLFLLVSSTHKKLHSEVGIDGNACSTQVHAALLSSFEPVFSVRCLASLDHRTGVEQPTDDLIIQNRKAVQSIGRSINWTLEDNMVKGLFFCATLTGRRGGHTPFVQPGADMSDTGVEAVEPDPRYPWLS